MIESGSGSPDHISKLGSLYTNDVDALIYIYTDLGWKNMSKSVYGDLTLSGSTSTTSLTTGYVSLPIPMTTKDSYGVTVVNSYEYYVNVDGNYFCSSYASVDDNGADVGNVSLTILTSSDLTVLREGVGYLQTGAGTNEIKQNNIYYNTVIPA